jgi:hypothetical protein
MCGIARLVVAWQMLITKACHSFAGRGKSPSVSTGICYSLSLSITPQGHDPPASKAEPKQQRSPAADSTPESCRPPQAMDAATKVRNAPTPSTVLSAFHSGICYSAAPQVLSVYLISLLLLFFAWPLQ